MAGFRKEGHILKLIKSLNINKASDPDNISARVLTICAEEIDQY